MKANEFVKKFGWELCIAVIQMSVHRPESVYWSMITDTTGGFIYKNLLGDHDNYVCIKDLKRLVESHELVSNFGGLKRAKRILKKAYTSFNTMISVVWNDKPFQCNIQKLENAIADVESCQ